MPYKLIDKRNPDKQGGDVPENNYELGGELQFFRRLRSVFSNGFEKLVHCKNQEAMKKHQRARENS